MAAKAINCHNTIIYVFGLKFNAYGGILQRMFCNAKLFPTGLSKKNKNYTEDTDLTTFPSDASGQVVMVKLCVLCG